MKKIILLIALTLGALQADNIVHYDVKEASTTVSKPNHPTTDIY
ncbi:MAG: hypothetical protein PHI38_02655 [Sulfurimonas sp.]|jgi:hypothetical protein|nr:hypothetical protein [Sulfurimonas sp.]MDD3475746.1 hypothetical protein [Sulfurimonas sp.]HUH43409.1 hypothetical protein [Sulfurimonas sp.]